MGAFSNMDYELQNSEAAVSDAFIQTVHDLLCDPLYNTV